jgi:hypothetical protein
MTVHEENHPSVKILFPKPSVSSTIGFSASMPGANFEASGQNAANGKVQYSIAQLRDNVFYRVRKASEETRF